MPTTVDNVEVLRAMLTKHGVNQRELSGLIDVTPETVNRWLNRRTVLTDKKLLRAIRELGDTPADYGIEATRTGRVVVPGEMTAHISASANPSRVDEVVQRLKLIADEYQAQPQWFTQFMEQHNAAVLEINRKLDALLRA